jgi:hypothetical protein
MSNTNRVAELSALIAENTAKVNQYLASRDIHNISFDADVSPQIAQDEGYSAPRDAVIEACNELSALLGGSFKILLAKNVNTNKQNT